VFCAVVNSQHHNVVVTAGHCVMKGGAAPTYNTDFTFIPDGHGRAPLRRLEGRTGLVNQGWGVNADIRYDYGFVDLLPNAQGKQVQDVVGANGLEFDGPTTRP